MRVFVGSSWALNVFEIPQRRLPSIFPGTIRGRFFSLPRIPKEPQEKKKKKKSEADHPFVCFLQPPFISQRDLALISGGKMLFSLRQSCRQAWIFALLLYASLLIMIAAVDDIPLGLCNEIGKDDKEQYARYVRKRYLPIPKFSNAINPAWKRINVPNLHDMTLTIDTDLSKVDEPKYYIHMDTSDHGDKNMFYQFVIKMTTSDGNTRLICPTNFMTCFIRVQDIKNNPQFSYLLDPFSYTKR